MARNVVLTEQAFVELRRMVHEQRQKISNLERHLAHVSTRRHQAVWAPGVSASIRLGSLVGSLSQGGTATATEITWNGSAFENGDTFTVQDFFLNLTESVDANTKIMAFKIGQIWVPLPYCNPSDTLPS